MKTIQEPKAGRQAIAEDWIGFTTSEGILYDPRGRPLCRCPCCKVPSSVRQTQGIVRYHKCLGYTHPITKQLFLGCSNGFMSVNWKPKTTG